MEREQWGKQAKESPLYLPVTKLLDEQQVKMEPTGDLELTFTISTATVDRQGDTIAIAGWKTDNFLAGGSVLFAHNMYAPPIGRPKSISLTQDALKAAAVFTPKDLYEFGYMIYQMAKTGFIRSTSVGFRPIKYGWVDRGDSQGFDFAEQELLEFSLVPVPANPEALVDGKNMYAHEMKHWAKNILDAARPHVYVPHQEKGGFPEQPAPGGAPVAPAVQKAEEPGKAEKSLPETVKSLVKKEMTEDDLADIAATIELLEGIQARHGISDVDDAEEEAPVGDAGKSVAPATGDNGGTTPETKQQGENTFLRIID